MLIISHPLPTTLEASTLGFLTTDWMSTKSRNATMYLILRSVQKLSTSLRAVFHCVRAARYLSSGEPILDPLPMKSLANHGSQTQSSFLSWIPSWIQASLPVLLIYFVLCVSVRCSHGICAAFSSTLWIICRFEVFMYNKILVPHWQTIENQGIEKEMEQAVPPRPPLRACLHSEISLAKAS